MTDWIKVKDMEYKNIKCPDCGRNVTYGVVKGEEREDDFECDECEHIFTKDDLK